MNDDYRQKKKKRYRNDLFLLKKMEEVNRVHF